MVAADCLEHLLQVIRREAYNINLWRKATHLEQEFQESEKRCQTLLANSKDAVAYVHEGMHIYANEVYLELFGHDSFDEIEGMPIIDMVEPSQQNELKTLLRQLGQNDNINQLQPVTTFVEPILRVIRNLGQFIGKTQGM